MASRLSSLVKETPLASAASLSQFERQLRQNPARFIRSMFCASVRSLRCSTRRRNAAASSSVFVRSSIAMNVIPSLPMIAYNVELGLGIWHVAAQGTVAWELGAGIQMLLLHENA